MSEMVAETSEASKAKVLPVKTTRARARAAKSAVSKGPGKRGHIVADTLLLMMFLGLRKLGNICCAYKIFLNKIRNVFASRTQNLCPQQMLRARANRETFVSATMCPQQCVLVYQGLKKTRARAEFAI